MPSPEINLQNRLTNLDTRYRSLNKEVRNWARASKQALLFAVARLDLAERIQLDNEIRLLHSIGFKIRRQQGQVEAIAFQFGRKGIFLERGVGRGMPVGSAKAGANKREWLGPTLSPRVELLADLLTEQYADLIGESLQLSIPGIIEFKITKS